MPDPILSPLLCPILIGRDAQVVALSRLLDLAGAGQGQIALISGEAGIGKSRLVAEVTRQATQQGFRVSQGRCFETDRSLPFAPLVELLRSQPDEVALSDSLIAGLSGRQRTPDEEPDQTRRRLFELLATHLTKPQQNLLVVEDLHWCDDATLEFLLFLARRLPQRATLFLLTYRNDEVDFGLARLLAAVDRERLASEIHLSPLAQQEISSMVRSIFGLAQPPQTDFIETLHGLTGGNPFFVEEVLKTCVTEGDIFQLGGHWGRKPLSQIQIPRTVQVAVQQRMAHLTPPARDLLTLVAVIGQQWHFDLLLQVSGLDERRLIALLKENVAAQLVVEETPDRFSFRHALTRQAVYGTLLARERRLLHRTVAETLERLQTQAQQSGADNAPIAPSAGASVGLSAALAYHCSAAGLWDKTLLYARRAGEEAQALHAPNAVVEQFSRALHAAEQLGLPLDLSMLTARGQAYEMLGDFAAAHADLEAVLIAAQDAGDWQAIWQSLLDLGFLWTSRDFARAGSYFTQALTVARSLGEPAAVAHTLNRVGNWHVNMGQPHDGRGYHEEALLLFQSLDDRSGVAATLDLLAGAVHFGGDLPKGMALYAQAAHLFRRLGNRRGLASSLSWLAFQGPTALNAMVAVAPLERCIEIGAEALQIAREIHWRPGEAFAMIGLAFACGAHGDFGAALTHAQTALHITQEIQHGWATVASIALGALYLDLDASALAQKCLEDAVALSRQWNIGLSAHNTLSFLALSHVQQQGFDQADALLGAAFGQPPLPTSTEDANAFSLKQRLYWVVRAELALGRGDAERARAIVAALLATTEAQENDGAAVAPRLHLLHAHALLKLRRLSAAADALQRAHKVALEFGARPLLWRIEAAMGRLASAQGEPDAAAAHYANAASLVEALAATVPDATLREHFLRHSATHIPVPPLLTPLQAAKQEFAGLTGREREVAALIAQGKSDREIAETLILSKRTVSTHVGNILNKLGFSSRSQIAAWAAAKRLNH